MKSIFYSIILAFLVSGQTYAQSPTGSTQNELLSAELTPSDLTLTLALPGLSSGTFRYNVKIYNGSVQLQKATGSVTLDNPDEPYTLTIPMSARDAKLAHTVNVLINDGDEQEAIVRAAGVELGDAVRRLSNLDGLNGFSLKGLSARDRLGLSVSDAGDINGDGVADWLVSSSGADHYVAPIPGAANVYVVLGGSRAAITGEISPASLDGSNGFVIEGATNGRYFLSVSGAGDVNRDGIDDLLIGAPSASPNGELSGAAYVVFGGSGLGASGVVSLADLNGSNGFVIEGAAADDKLGVSVSAAGDINGDGIDDLLLGASGADPNGDDSGAAYVVFGGNAVGASGSIDLGGLASSAGFVLEGLGADDNLGASVSGAGDINGDGVADLLVGATSNGPNVDAGYVVFGGSGVGASGRVALSNLDGTNGFVLEGAALPRDWFGRARIGAGDINGDGVTDMFIGTSRFSTVPTRYESYVVFGGNTVGASGRVSLGSLDGTNGFALEGEFAGSLSGGGDVNGDGVADLLFGATWANPDGVDSGAAYVVFGGSSVGAGGRIVLSNLNGESGVLLKGVRPASSTGVVSSGDINGDGIADVLIGAPGTGPNGNDAGVAYVVFGSACLGENFCHQDNNNELLNTELRPAELEVSLDVPGLTGGILRYTIEVFDGLERLREITGSVVAQSSGEPYKLTLPLSAEEAQIADHINILVYDGNLPEAILKVENTQIGVDTTRLHTNLNGSNGFFIEGSYRNPSSLSRVGDINEDGIDDLLIGAGGASPNGFRSGASYVVFGGSAIGANGEVLVSDLTDLNGANGFVLEGESTQDQAGIVVGSAGDLNDDGVVDLVVAADGYAIDGYRAYVVYGGRGVGATGKVPLSSLNGTNGFVLQGARASSISGADINGDGVDDLLLGDSTADPNGSASGAVYVVFGGRGAGAGGRVSVSNLDGTNGFVLEGLTEGDGFGGSVSGAGDINRDGVDDIIIGAPGIDRSGVTSAGAAYVVFGGSGVGAGGAISLSGLNGLNGFVLEGTSFGEVVGRSVSGVGDVNRDGVADLLIGARDNYVLFGGGGVGSGGRISTSSLDGTNGFVLEDLSATNFAGSPVSGPGDINGDGVDDLLIGSSNRNTAYVVYGGSDLGGSGKVALSGINGTNGFKLLGESRSTILGRFVSGLGDINGDGLADLQTGSNYTRYILFGSPCLGKNFCDDDAGSNTGGPNILDGTSGDDFIISTEGDDIVNLGAGSDRFVAWTGNDIINGGPAGDYDQVNYPGSSTDYTFTQNSDGSVSVAKPNSEVDTLTNIDGIWFDGDSRWMSVSALLVRDADSGSGPGDPPGPSDEGFVFAEGDSVTGAIQTVEGFTLDDTIDLTALGFSPDDIETRIVGGGSILKLIEGFGAGDFQLRVRLDGVTAEEVLARVNWGSTSVPSGKVYAFAAGDSVTGAVETISDFSLDASIDLSALGLAPEDVELRTVGGGTVLKLIEGFSAGDFQLKVQLNGLTADQVTSRITWATNSNPMNPGVDPEANIWLATDNSVDNFVFRAGESSTAAVDTIVGLEMNDNIDLTSLGLSPDSVEQRIVGGGTVLKLIDGFGADDFQLKIDLGSLTVQEVVSRIRW